MFTKSRICFLLLFILSLEFPFDLLRAASDPNASEQAGSLEKELREREKNKRLEEIELPVIESKVPEEEGAGLPETEFPISSIKIIGNTFFKDDVFDPLKKPYEHQTSNLKKLKSLTKDITSYYRMRGYVTSRAILPPQQLEQGSLTIQIIEGKVGQIKIEGLKYSRESMIRNRFALKPGDILRYQNLERSLVNLNANPDRTVRVVLLPGEKPETTDIVLKIEEKFPFHANYGFNNLGTVSTGRLRESTSVSASNLLGIDDQFTSRIEIAERRDFVGFSNSYLVPLDSRGDLLSFDFSRVNVELGKDLKPFNASGRALVFGPTFIFPFLQTKYLSGEWTSGFDFKRIRTILGGRANSKDDLRVFKFGPNFIENDKWGKTILSNQFQFAIAGFLGGLGNNDPVASRREADGTFFQYNVTFGRLQNIWHDTQGVFRMSAQLTPHRLVPAQQFRLGGFDTVRGFPEGDYLGDYGFQGSFELRVPPYFIPQKIKWPATTIPIRDSVRCVGFVDFGRAFVSSPFPEEDKSRTLVGIGGGIRVSLAKNIQARVDWGVPVGRKSSQTNGGGTHLHFSLQVGF